MNKPSFPRKLAVKWILTLVLLGVLGYCLYQVITLVRESCSIQQDSAAAVVRYVRSTDSPEESDPEEEEDEVLLPENPIDFAALQADSPWAVGWIQLSGLDTINYPLVYSGDNSYFLTHTWDGNDSRYGAIFVDGSCSPDLSDCYTIIYGHNMKDGTMFGSLKKYKDEAYYQENGGIVTICLPGEVRTYQMFALRYAVPTEKKVYTLGFAHDDIFQDFLDTLVESSLYDTGVTVTKEDNVVALSTCSGSYSRLVLFLKLVDVTVTQ